MNHPPVLFLGARFVQRGGKVGKAAKGFAGGLLPTYIGGNPINPSIPILLQDFGRPTPYPGYIGTTVEQGISNIPSFLGGDSQEGSKP